MVLCPASNDIFSDSCCHVRTTEKADISSVFYEIVQICFTRFNLWELEQLFIEIMVIN